MPLSYCPRTCGGRLGAWGGFTSVMALCALQPVALKGTHIVFEYGGTGLPFTCFLTILQIVAPAYRSAAYAIWPVVCAAAFAIGAVLIGVGFSAATQDDAPPLKGWLLASAPAVGLVWQHVGGPFLDSVALAILAGTAISVVLALRAAVNGGQEFFTKGQVSSILAQQEAEYAREFEHLKEAYRELEEEVQQAEALEKVSDTLTSVLTHDGINRAVKGFLHPDHAKTEKERRAREELFKRWGICVDWAKSLLGKGGKQRENRK